MSLEVELTNLDGDGRWEIQITVHTPSLGESSQTIIYIEVPYRSTLEDWREITGGDCAMRLSRYFSLDDGYYQFNSSRDYGSNFCMRIKEELLRDKLSKIIDKAVELNLVFGDNEYTERFKN